MTRFSDAKERQKRSDKELREASVHLQHEITQMEKARRAHLATDPKSDPVVWNALIESFLIHARAIENFLYRDAGWDDDVLAGDYFDSPNKWRSLCPPAKNRWTTLVGKAVAHLSYQRSPLLRNEQIDLDGIKKDLELGMRAFAGNVAERRLDSTWKDFLDEWERLGHRNTPEESPEG